ncbi:solute carrier family 46 member 3-like [Dreissena polymorpha]|uniref:Major facilitator superfamily (MFS) profile domain-containing protein n=1 Tax=Dreissena polymorpha TaxID=45954 RepID=A0A9D4LQT0_DREPO|nr:solute carrier family 46 member 3-like [Dreissena polymorpha]KAH3862092.1 hypothetical protein DPMN_025053 [Dreissena polymorpha]
MYSYVLYERTQAKMREQYFPNSSLDTNFSACDNINKTSLKYQQHKQVQQQSANWLIFYNLGETVPMVFMNIVITAYTDSFGRKFLILLTTFGTFFKAGMLSLIVTFDWAPVWVVMSYIVYGFTGGMFGLLSAVFAFIADITYTDDHRIIGIVVTECVLMSTSMVAPYLSGYFVETLSLGFSKTSFICVGMCFFSFSVLLLLPESLAKHNRQKAQSIIQNIKRVTDFYVSKEMKGQRTRYILLMLSFWFATVAGMCRTSIETLYFLGQPFCWGPSKIGLFMTAVNAAKSVIGLGSLRLLQVCLSNPVIAIISTVSLTISYIIEGLAQSTLVIYLGPITGMFSFLMLPMIRGMMSTITPADKQGAMFAGVAVFEVLSSLVGSIAFNGVYSLTMTFMNGFVFLCMAFLSVLDTILLLAYNRIKPPPSVISVAAIN